MRQREDIRQLLGLIRSDLDPRNTTDAAQWISLALGHNTSLLAFWRGEQDAEGEDAQSVLAQFMDGFGDKSCIDSPQAIFRPSQTRTLSTFIDDEHASSSGERLWPWVATALSDRPTMSLVIIANEPLCRGLVHQYLNTTEKPTIERPRGEILFAGIDLSKNWPHSIVRER